MIIIQNSCSKKKKTHFYCPILEYIFHNFFTWNDKLLVLFIFIFFCYRPRDILMPLSCAQWYILYCLTGSFFQIPSFQQSPRSKRSVEKCTTFSWSKATILHHDDEDVMISHQSVDRRKYSLASRIRHTRIFHSKSNYLYMLDFPFALSFMLIGTLFGFCLFVCVRRRRRLRGLSRGSTNTTTGTRIMGSAHSSSTSSLPPSSLSWTAAHHAPAPMLV